MECRECRCCRACACSRYDPFVLQLPMVLEPAYCSRCQYGDCYDCRARTANESAPAALQQTHHNCPDCGANHAIRRG